ncbi:MAG: hypothetical protein D6795_07335 [Deltaproteobacteria bacterium]|nr:MAG: hypothetical protein D6795_07335 [Deltaproteobacteria bacterium]
MQPGSVLLGPSAPPWVVLSIPLALVIAPILLARQRGGILPAVRILPAKSRRILAWHCYPVNVEKQRENFDKIAEK